MNQKLFTYQSSPYFSKDFLTLFLIILGNITFASRVSQLLSITHEICKCFNFHPICDIRGTFLDIFKILIKFGMRV